MGARLGQCFSQCDRINTVIATFVFCKITFGYYFLLFG